MGPSFWCKVYHALVLLCCEFERDRWSQRGGSRQKLPEASGRVGAILTTVASCGCPQWRHVRDARAMMHVRTANPYPVKYGNTMMALTNIDETVLQDRMHPQQLTLPKMYCGVILSIMAIAKKNCHVMPSHHCDIWTDVTPEHIKRCFMVLSGQFVALLSVTWHEM